MAMTPGKPVPETLARNAVGTVFALCGAIAGWVLAPHGAGLLFAAGAGLAAMVAGTALASLPYRITRGWYR